MADLAPSMESLVNTGLTGKAARSVIPGSKLLSSFQPAADRQVNNAEYFVELGSQLLHQQPLASALYLSALRLSELKRGPQQRKRSYTS